MGQAYCTRRYREVHAEHEGTLPGSHRGSWGAYKVVELVELIEL